MQAGDGQAGAGVGEGWVLVVGDSGEVGTGY